MSERKISFETREDVAMVAGYLNSLATGFAQQRVLLSSGKEEIQLYPTGEVEFKVKARVKKSEGKIEFKLAWKDEGEPENIIIS